MKNNIKIALNYGVLAGVTAFGLILLLYISGVNPLGNFSWITFWVPILFITLAIKNHRDNNQNGYIKYGEGLWLGILLSLVYASLYAMLMFMFGSFVAPEIVDVQREETIIALEPMKDAMPELYDRLYDEVLKLSITSIATSEFFNKAIWGTILSLVIAAILKRQPSIFEEEETENA
jgi:hypothetical protein